MTEDVKPRRQYDSSRRREQAAQTRRDIVTAAGTLFRERGYGVSMPEIAAEAGVVVETVYRIFGTKAGLFRAVVEALLAGGAARAERPVEERDAIRALIEEPDPARQVAMYAGTQPGIHRRAGPDPAGAPRCEGRRPGARPAVGRDGGVALRGPGAVRAGCSPGGVSSALTGRSRRRRTWSGPCARSRSTTSSCVDRGWDEDRYEAWLAETLARELLG